MSSDTFAYEKTFHAKRKKLSQREIEEIIATYWDQPFDEAKAEYQKIADAMREAHSPGARAPGGDAATGSRASGPSVSKERPED